MKEHVPTKKTKFLHSHVVNYFTGSKAIDELMGDNSPWKPVKGKGALEVEEGQLVFDTREKCVEFLDTLLRHKMFHRAKKIPVTEKDKESRMGWKAMKKNREEQEIQRQEEENKEQVPPDTDPEKESEDKSEEEKAKEEKPEKSGEKKKRKIRLDMHLEQIYVDSNDAFVWLYDPIPWYYWLAGGAICMLVIMLCLFPLWPKLARKGTQWIFTGVIGFLVGVLLLGIFKYSLFAILYLLSARKFRFWIMPNLTKDVSFLNSFWPLYEYTYTGEIEVEAVEEDEEKKEEVLENNTQNITNVNHEDSDSNESGKSAFEFVEKSKDE